MVMHLKHPEIYERLGVTPARGLLLHGPPGCGKSLFPQAVAGVNFFEISVAILKGFLTFV